MEYRITTENLKSITDKLAVGDKVFLSGTVYTARDAAHKRIFEYMADNKPLPFSVNGSIIYYAGPTPTPEGLAIGSCGPTTSFRMDKYTPRLLDMGLTATVGKGGRSAEVKEAIKRNGSVYLCAIGGAGALAARCITKCEVTAFEDLGCESVKRLEFKDFPLIVGINAKGESIFER